MSLIAGAPFLEACRRGGSAPTCGARRLLVASTQTRHDDVIVQRRFGQSATTRAVTQIYAITYPGHTDRGSEHESYTEAEQIAIALGRDRKVSVWFEETPYGGRRTLLSDFRSTD